MSQHCSFTSDFDTFPRQISISLLFSSDLLISTRIKTTLEDHTLFASISTQAYAGLFGLTVYHI
jgi:hypothetical protein